MNRLALATLLVLSLASCATTLPAYARGGHSSGSSHSSGWQTLRTSAPKVHMFPMKTFKLPRMKKPKMMRD